LGPFEIDADPPVVIARRRERWLLAVLLLEHGHTVAFHWLADMLWDGAPPDNARDTVNSHVSRLRAAVRDGVRISWQRTGYRLDTDPETIDAYQFRVLVEQAREVGDPARRAELLRSALNLWRGPVLADLATTVAAQRLGVRLEELRVDALDERIAADLDLGRHRELIGELRELVTALPTHDSFTGHLILALFRSGRQREALAVFEDHRQLLAAELGLRPGSRLRRLHEQILRADPALDLSEPVTIAGPPVVTPVVSVPRQLPHDNAGFIGREPELARLHELSTSDGRVSTIITIDGAPGTGKTTLAVHFAHQVACRFPDVQLYLHLCGYGPGEPLTAARAIEKLLRSLGVDSQVIPPETEEHSALLRSTLAGRNVLLLLDDARDADTVRALLPGTGCLVIVTSRNQLRGLSIRDGAHRVTLGAMPHDEALALLAATVGADRVSAEQDAAEALVALCGRLPLALAIVAEQAGRLGTLAEAVAALSDEKARLDALGYDGSDPRADLRATISWSYRALPEDAATMLRKLGPHPANDFGLPAAAALAGMSLTAAKASLDALVVTHLVEQHRPDRYELHDLIRLYANELSANEPSAARTEAIRRMLDYYLHACLAADTMLRPHRLRDFVDPYQPSAPTPLFNTVSEAAQWFHCEQDTVRAVALWAMSDGWAGYGWRIALAATCDVLHSVPTAEGLAFFTAIAAGSESAGEPIGQAYALNSLALLHMINQDFASALPIAERALALFVRHQHRIGETMLMCNLAEIYSETGERRQALRYTGTALDLSQEIGYASGTAMNLINLGVLHTGAGEYDQAIECHRQADTVLRGHDDPILRAKNLHQLGRAHAALGDVPKAARAFRVATELHRNQANFRWAAGVLADFGTLLAGAGHPKIARGMLTIALDKLGALADPRVSSIEAELANLS
jgi:DNA-binding SARP family transcriptional activator